MTLMKIIKLLGMIQIAISSVCCSEMDLKANTNITKQSCDDLETGILLGFPDVLEGFSSFTLFFSAPSNIPGEYKKKKELMIHEIEKFGQVIWKETPILNPFESGNVMSDMITGPSLSFTVSRVEDMKGNELQIQQVTLTLEAGTTINKNGAFCHSILWSRSCFVKDDLIHQPEIALTQALSKLLKEFEKEYFKSNQAKPTFYIAY
ncbi:MAG: hypothetical protein JSS60_03550 [Verrucomicrobia bacterium]|nr:hypothetical protein [Verrucomicrobiota bacterium]